MLGRLKCASSTVNETLEACRRFANMQRKRIVLVKPQRNVYHNAAVVATIEQLAADMHRRCW